MFPTRYQVDRFEDGGWRNCQWAGHLEVLRRACDGDFLPAGDAGEPEAGHFDFPEAFALAEPETEYFGRLAYINLFGIVHRSGWLRLAAAIEEAAAAPRTSSILVAIASGAQQIPGYGHAEEALAAASRRLFTVAHIAVGYGLSLGFAHRARLVVANAAASIGHIAGSYPWGRPANWPDEHRITEIMWRSFDGCPKKPSDAALKKNFPRLFMEAAHAEQLEGDGFVHHLVDLQRLILLLSRKGMPR